MLVLSPRSQSLTITRWLYGELRRAILDGRLRRGAPVPTTRSLALEYGVSRRIVVNVFNQLRDEGYLQARVGSGTRVSQNVPEDFQAAAPISARSVGVKKNPSVENAPPWAAYRRPIRPFRAFEPALSEFPTELWARLTGRCLRRADITSFAGGHPAGSLGLRKAIAEYLGSSRGVNCSPDQLAVTSGAQEGLDVLSRVLLRPGDRVWVEDPGYGEALTIFRLAGAEIIPVPVDEHGLDLDAGRRRCPKPKAVYVTPSHQFPLGVTLSLDRRFELLRWAATEGVVIIEDDYDSEFRFSGRPVPAVKGLPNSGNVFLVGTFSKCLFPALRLGYVVVPDAWIDAVLRLRFRVERYPPALSQLVLASFFDQGHFARHLRRMRELYAARLGALRRSIERHLDGALKLPDIEAGLHTPAYLMGRLTSDEAARRARRRKVEVLPLDRFALARNDIRGLLLGFAAFHEREIQRAVTELARALQ